MARSLDWNDLRFVLAIHERGSLAAAARGLGVRLFDRLPTGYVLTSAGEALLPAARSVAETIVDLERRIAGQDLRLTGSLRVATTDTLALGVLPPHLARFRARHQGVAIELSTSNEMANLSKRDADVAVRPARNPPETLVGRRVCEVALAIYASPRYLERTSARKPLAEHVWVTPDDSLASTSVGRWLRRDLAEARVSLRADSYMALRDAATAGLGVAALPCYVGDRCPTLVRIREPLRELATELWILTHADLRHTARVRAFVELLAEGLGKERPLIEGRSPRRPVAR
jgi:DNA-binding transcriptional LysR family regulator